jgi:RimJ/RimL family protein N-acetyltransferase
MIHPTVQRLLRGLARRVHGADRIAIRAIRPDDRARLLAAFHALDRRSIYQRFFFSKRELSEADLRQLTACDGVRVVVLVATDGDGEQEAIVGLGQYARHGATAQIAFAVREEYQGRGISTRLLQRLVRIAREQGVSHFEADVLTDNKPMLAVFRHSGLPLETREDDGVVHLTLALGELPAPPGAGADESDRTATVCSPSPGGPRLP